MSISQASRDFNKEISIALNSNIQIFLEKDYPKHFFKGRLIGYEVRNHTICLENAKDENHKKFDKLFIHGNKWLSFTILGEPFPMEALANRLRKILPGEAIRIANNNTISLLGGKLIVTENGVKGRGPTKQRVEKVFQNFVADLKSK